MNKIIRCVSAVAVFTSLLTAAYADGKLITDPNTQPQTQPVKPLPVGVTDKRLDKKVTVCAGNARLHDVIADLSAKGGVTIYCGRNNEDWQIRDIPVTVAAADLPLRKVLEYVTFCTNSVLTSKTSDKGEVVYRVVMNPTLKQAMDGYLEAKKTADFAYYKREMQMAAKLKDIPPADIKCPGNGRDDWRDHLDFLVAASKLIAQLDEKTIDSIVAGEPLVMALSDAPESMRPSLNRCLDAFDAVYLANARKPGMGRADGPEPIRATDAELQRGRLKISREGIGLTISGYVPAPEGDKTGDRICGYGISIIGDLALENNNGRFVPIPQPKYAEVPKGNAPAVGYKELVEGMAGFPAAVTLKLEDEKKTPSSADFRIALSKAAGVPIVYADFWTHQSTSDVKKAFGKELPFVGTMMKTPGVKWFVDTANHNALVGQDADWVEDFRTLMPADILDNLMAKAHGDGAGLDDIVPISLYDKQASLNWIRGTYLPEFPDFTFCDPAKKPVWAFYASLGSREKSQVRSAAGLSLARTDIAPIAQWIQAKVKINAADIWERNPSKQDMELKRLAAPEVLANLTLRIETRTTYRYPPAPGTLKSEETPGPATVPRGFLEPTDYTLYVIGADKEGEIKHEVDRITLPYFHPDRKKELSAEMQKQPAKTADRK